MSKSEITSRIKELEDEVDSILLDYENIDNEKVIMSRLLSIENEIEKLYKEFEDANN